MTTYTGPPRYTLSISLEVVKLKKMRKVVQVENDCSILDARHVLRIEKSVSQYLGSCIPVPFLQLFVLVHRKNIWIRRPSSGSSNNLSFFLHQKGWWSYVGAGAANTFFFFVLNLSLPVAFKLTQSSCSVWWTKYTHLRLRNLVLVRVLYSYYLQRLHKTYLI